jgi:hypothetical protein
LKAPAFFAICAIHLTPVTVNECCEFVDTETDSHLSHRFSTVGINRDDSCPPELGNIVPGAFTPVLAKHSKSFSLIDCVSVGVDRMQRNFEHMQKQVEAWQRSEIADVCVEADAFADPQIAKKSHLWSVSGWPTNWS